MRWLATVLVLIFAAGAAAAAAPSVRGTASYRERIALPPGAVFEAVLEDVSLADAPAIELGRTTVQDPGNPPFAFKIDYDPAKVRDAHVYTVRAQVSVGRKLIFVSDKINPVLTGGAGNEVQIWMIKVGDTAQEAQAAPTQIGAHGLRLPASFGGELPCDDCDGVRYQLNLWPDQVFHMRRTRAGTDERRDTIGRWAVDPDQHLLTLRGGDQDVIFRILGPDRIEMVPDGAPTADPSHYVLTAGPEFRDFSPHLPLRGMLTYDADEARFTECRTGRDYPLVRDDGDYAALEHAYLAAGAEPDGPIMASFDGAILPKGDGGEADRPAVLVERFVGVWPGETCDRTAGTATLTNTYWKILRLGDVTLATEPGRREPNLILRQNEQRFTATVGCNQMIGSYDLVGDALSFTGAASTRMACPAPVDDWERRLGLLLSETRGYRIDGQTLELLGGDGQSLGLFQAVYLY